MKKEDQEKNLTKEEYKIKLDTEIEGDANKMGSAPIGKLLASMAWPAIISMTINAL